MSKKRSRTADKRSPKTVAFWVFIPVALVAIVAGYFVSTSRSSADSGYVSTYVPGQTSAPAPITPHHQIPQVMQRLNDPSHAFNLVVLGDSTGAAREGWVVQVARALGAKTGRAVDFHQWSVEQEPDVYLAPWSIARGGGQPVTVWNGSASGKNAEYTRAHWDELVPIPHDQVDLVLINHGHNEPAGALPGDALSLGDMAVAQFPNAAVAAILQNPQRPGSQNADAQDRNVTDMQELLTTNGFETIDVHTPYRAMPGWETAFDAGDLHPNQAGYDLWTGVVRQALGI